MLLWAIQHAPSGAFLPAPKGRGGRGGTHVEPTHSKPPRLFQTEGQAKCALTNWLAGKVTVTIGGWEDDDENWRVEPTPHRKREDMAVVPIRLIPATQPPKDKHDDH